MIEVTGDMWTMHGYFRCIPTNGTFNARGEIVMGRGVAQQAKAKYPWLPKELAELTRKFGLRVIMLPELMIAFPVKYKWSMKASLMLIHQSTSQLLTIAKVVAPLEILLPRPGCGNGGLLWKDVKPIVQVLPDNVKVLNYG